MKNKEVPELCLKAGKNSESIYDLSFNIIQDK